MDLNKLTIKSLEAFQSAQELAARRGHIEVDGEHLLAALVEQEGNDADAQGLRIAINP